MSTALGLAMQITANTAQLAQAVADVNKRLDSMADAGKKAADDLGTLKNIEIGKLALGGIKAATSAFLGLSSSVLGAVQSVTSFALSVGEELDALNDVANRTGIGVEALQAYARAAEMTGVNVESFAKQMQKLTLAIGAATVDEKQRKKFEELGISFEQLKNASPEEQFEMVADALANVADFSERAKRATAFFGKGGAELNPLFEEGAGYLARMRQDAIALGQVVGNDAVQAIDSMNDSFKDVFRTIKGIAGAILGELAGPISTIAQELLGVIRQAGPQQIAQQVASGLLDFIKLAGNAFLKLAQFIAQFVEKYSGILGLELRSPEQIARDQEISALRSQIGVPAGVLDPALRQEIINEQAPLRARLATLEAQAAAEASNSVLSRFQANFDAAINTASESLRQRIEGQAASAEPNDAERRQVQLLEQINRNGQVGVVEFL